VTHKRIAGLAGVAGVAGWAASGAVSAARHPVAAAGYVVGLAKGATTATVDAVRRGRSGVVPQQRGPSEPRTAAATPPEPARPGERTLYGGLNTEAAPPRSPGGGGVEVGHEPAAESRAVAHGDAPTSPREVESWLEEAADAEVDDEVGPTTDPQQPDTETEPLIDPGTAKAVRSEAERMQKAADPEKG
jgi:hypothetical protein